jgi:UDPglucose 6-dehydrogenase
MSLKVSIFGLGKLGSTLAGVMAHKRIIVKGYDILHSNVQKVNKGIPPVYEKKLDLLFRKNKKRIFAYSKTTDCIKDTNITFVVTPTPSLSNGSFDLSYCKKSFEELGVAIKKKGSYHTIVLISTVLPGSTTQILIKSLENKTGLKLNKNFGVCYSPAFIALGSIIKDFLNPDFILLGYSNLRSKKHFQKIYNKLIKKPIYRPMTIENAELAKIAVNTFLTTKITFANMLSKIAEKLPSGDIDQVCMAVGSDSRIGNKYLNGGIGYGGPCFPRDNLALSYIAKSLSVSAPLAKVTHDYNEKISINFIKQYKKLFKKKTIVAVLGISYKTGSNWLEKSQGFDIALRLSRVVKKVYCHDPLAKKIETKEFKKNMILTDNLYDVINKASLIIIANNEKVYKKLNLSKLSNKKIFDFWRILKLKKNSVQKNYFPVGKYLNQPH